MPAELVLLEGGSRLRGVSPAGLRDALECVAGEGMIEAQEEAVKREASQKIADGDLGSEGVSSYVVGGAFLNVTWKTPTHSAPITWIAEELSPSGKWSLIGGDRSALTAQLPLTTNGSFARVTLRRGAASYLIGVSDVARCASPEEIAAAMVSAMKDMPKPKNW